jgi:hypothetical protein
MSNKTEDGLLAVLMGLGCLMWVVYVGLIFTILFFLAKFLIGLS